MSTRVTERDLQNFASVGFPASVRAREEPDAASLRQSVVRVLESPSARLAGAAALALIALADRDELVSLHEGELPDGVRRRLGYLAERLSDHPRVEGEVASRLAELAEQLSRSDDERRRPLTFMAKTTATLLQLLSERTDDVNNRWNVLGGFTLPETSTRH